MQVTNYGCVLEMLNAKVVLFIENEASEEGGEREEQSKR